MKSSKLDFVEEAETFLIRNRGRVFFWLLKFYTKCSDYELDYLIRKIYCCSLKSSQQIVESELKTGFGVLFLPFFFLYSKRILWKRQSPTRYKLETIDEQYFRSRYSTIYEGLEGTKCVTPRYRGSISGQKTTEPAAECVSLAALLRMFLVSICSFIPLYFFCRRSRIDIRREYRNALSLFATFDGYMKRSPCEDFITYEDHSNHPSRYIAFRQNSKGRFIVIQNGERGYHPSWAFGMVDVYFVFGEYYSDLLKDLGYHIGHAFASGSLTLNQHFFRLQKVPKEIKHDIIYIDNGSIAPPLYGGLAEAVARSEETALSHLSRFKADHHGLRIAYQLRPYGEDHAQKEAVLSVFRRHFTEEIEVLDNSGSGESYVNIKQSRLAVTFQSTMGFEAFMLGTKTLFINYSGHPNETLCEDERFQLEDNNASYEVFEQKLLSLIGLELESVPGVALRRHAIFNGRVQEDIAATINRGC